MHCWSHLRRRFVKQMRNTKPPIAEAAVRQIAALYAVETTVRGMTPADRLAARRKLSAPITLALRPWFEKQLSMISSGSTLATDFPHALAHWAGLTRFLDDGRLELDTNPVENAIRPVETGTPHACYAILDRLRTGWTATFRYVCYDHMSMAALARRNGREDWASALSTGWIR
jgi:transposase